MIFDPNITSFIIGMILPLLIFMVIISIIHCNILIEIHYYLNSYEPRNNRFEKLCQENNLVGICRKKSSYVAMVSPIYKYYNILFYNDEIERRSEGLQELVFWHEYGHLKGIESEKSAWDYSKEIMQKKYGKNLLKKTLWELIKKSKLDGVCVEYILKT